jgi:hypothetical protein
MHPLDLVITAPNKIFRGGPHRTLPRTACTIACGEFSATQVPIGGVFILGTNVCWTAASRPAADAGVARAWCVADRCKVSSPSARCRRGLASYGTEQKLRVVVIQYVRGPCAPERSGQQTVAG